jgi:hypothetical protein
MAEQETILRVWREGPIIGSEWRTTDDLIAAVAAVALLLVGENELPEAVRMAAVSFTSALSDARRVDVNVDPGPGEPS